MKRIALGGVALALVLTALGFSGGTKLPQEVRIDVEARNPWTHLRWNNGGDTFHFAVVSDRTGGHRARIFSQAVDQLNLLQPSFVVSVGDLIEGYSKDMDKVGGQWKEFQGYVHRLQMPFFYVPGNHDLSNATQVDEWKGRFGRRYYHFLYKDVLFLAVATDDVGEDKANGGVSREQIDYFLDVLKTNSKVRWTVVLLHKPIWAMEKAKSEGWLEVEQALAGRNYTVFAGHLHRFQKYVRNGMNYYQLATTGGDSKLRGMAYKEFDHITWVTMKAEGPTIAHLKLDGILPEDLKSTPTTEEGVVRYNRKPTVPVRGRVVFNGAPVPGAKVTFNTVEAATKKVGTVSDATVEEDGTFVMSTHEAWDGTPVGEYSVTIVLRQPLYDEKGQPGVNRLPGKYASVFTSGLKASIKSGTNDLQFELTP